MTIMFKVYNTIKFLTCLAAFSLSLAAAGCNQDSIFSYISEEAAPTKAKIKGSPSKIVKATVDGKERLYVANGRIWECEAESPAASWSRIAGPEGYVVDIASTSDGVLYALAIDNTATEVWKKDGTGWAIVALPGDYRFIQNIFSAGDILFATGGKRAGGDYEYAILYYKQQDSGFTVSEPLGKATLRGAGKVGPNYYLATLGNGIYKDSGDLVFKAETATPPIPAAIAGFLQVKTDSKEAIIGIGRGGLLVYIDASGITVDSTSLGGTYTGALFLTDIPKEEQDGFENLLLLGYQGSNSSYEHGYMELQFNSDTGTHQGTRRIPGENQPSSISGDRQYDSSLRRYPANAFWVLPIKEGAAHSVIFASTSNQGLYSYRNRSDGGWQWNHEE
jgi:hypothetical protein